MLGDTGACNRLILKQRQSVGIMPVTEHGNYSLL